MIHESLKRWKPPRRSPGFYELCSHRSHRLRLPCYRLVTYDHQCSKHNGDCFNRCGCTIEVINMTDAEWDQALANTLAEIGLTWEQLTEQAKTGVFSSLQARRLWLMAGPRGFTREPQWFGDRLAAEWDNPDDAVYDDPTEKV